MAFIKSSGWVTEKLVILIVFVLFVGVMALYYGKIEPFLKKKKFYKK